MDLMKAAVLERAPGGLRIEEIPVPEPRANEILVRVAACGVCHTDLHVMKAEVAFPTPAVMGHEITGTVVALQMVNPHTHIVFDVVDNGKTVRWQAELGTPQQLIQQFGWTPQTVKAGMKLTMIGRQLKGKAPFLNLTERANIVVADTGKEIYRTANFGKAAPPKSDKGSFIAQ